VQSLYPQCNISRRVAAIAYMHDQAGHPNPMAHPTVKYVWKGLQREIGVAQKGKAALTVDHLRTVVAPFGVRRIDVRDRAILLLGFTAAARIPRRARCARCRRGSRRSPTARRRHRYLCR
jgi:hypothetical protein